MDVSGHSNRETTGMERAIEKAQQVAETESFIPNLKTRDILGFSAILGAGLLYLGSRAFDVPFQQVLTHRISTENALTLYTTMAGIGGFLANLIASSQISTIEGGETTVLSILPPIAIQIVGAVVAAAAFPSERDTALPI